MGMAGPKRGKRQPMADINVTPLVDVMLVLLIIFMVTAPLLVAGVKVDLPNAKAAALPQDQTPIQISMNAAGEMFIDKLAVPRASLAAKLAALRSARQDDPRVYVRADRTLDYGTVMQLVSAVSAAGFAKVALVSDPSAAAGDAPAP
jgi:biopolymer transport protein TolR